jgi:enoyl-CoA hydratase/carnithine racemase
MTTRIRREDREGLCTLTLDRPEKLNALDTATFEELDAHCAAVEDQTETIGCVVLRGAGRAFCAGADIGGIGAAGQGFTDSRFKPGVIARLSRLPQPVIAGIHGVCFTGGLELALAADLIVAGRSARFADTHGKWGLVGAWGMTQRLPRRVGLAPAKRLMFTAQAIEAPEAAALGLVDVLADDAALDETIEILARQILANSWHTNRETKKLLAATDGMELAQGLAYEFDHYPGFAPDYAERIAGFTKK